MSGYRGFLAAAEAKNIALAFPLVSSNGRETLKVIARLCGLIGAPSFGWLLSGILAVGETFSISGFLIGAGAVILLCGIAVKFIGTSYNTAGTIYFETDGLRICFDRQPDLFIEFEKIRRTKTAFGISATGSYARYTPMTDALTVDLYIYRTSQKTYRLSILNRSSHTIVQYAHLVTYQLDDYIRYLKIRSWRRKTGLDA
jgi:hypothetical protein